MRLIENNCEIEFQGKTFSANGAYVDDKYANVYVVDDCIKSWHGKVLADRYERVSEWIIVNKYGECSRMRAIRFTIDGITYSGRYNHDNSQLCKARSVKK